jgi:hypothetical protein
MLVDKEKFFLRKDPTHVVFDVLMLDSYDKGKSAHFSKLQAIITNYLRGARSRRFTTAINSPPTVPILSQSNPIHIPQTSLLIHSDPIFSPTSWSSEWSLSF